MKPYTLYVTIYGAKDLKSKTGKHKFCVEAKVNKAKQKSELVEDLFGNPTFNKEFIFPVDGLNYELKLKVKEKNDRDILGQVKVQITDLQNFKSETPERAPLRPHKKCSNPSGELLFDAWVTGVVDPANLNLKKKTSSIESLKSLSGLKKIQEKLHASVAKLHHSKNDDENDDDSVGLDKKKKFKLFSNKNRLAASCGNLTTSQKGMSLFHKNAFKKSVQDPSPGGSIENISKIDLFNSFGRKTNSGSIVMNYKLPPPEVTGLSPKMGSKNGGTVVTIRGSNFGESGGELLHVYVCGVDMVKNTKHISSTKLMCTTLPCQPCTGNIVVETKFGGLGSCAVEFSFVEKEENSDYEEIKLLAEKDLDYLPQKVSSTNVKDEDSISGNSSGSTFRNRNLGIIMESSSDENIDQGIVLRTKVTNPSLKNQKKLEDDDETNKKMISNYDSFYNHKHGDGLTSKSNGILSTNDFSQKSHDMFSPENLQKDINEKFEKNDDKQKIEMDCKISGDKDDDETGDNDYSVIVNKLNRASINAQMFEEMIKNSPSTEIYNKYDQNVNRINRDNIDVYKNAFDSRKSQPEQKNEEVNSTFFKPAEVKTSHISIQLKQSPDTSIIRETRLKSLASKNLGGLNEKLKNDSTTSDLVKPIPRASFKISPESSSSDDDSLDRRYKYNISKIIPTTTTSSVTSHNIIPSTTAPSLPSFNSQDANFKSEIKMFNALNKEASAAKNVFDLQTNNDDDQYSIVDKIVTGRYLNSKNRVNSTTQQPTTKIVTQPATQSTFPTTTATTTSTTTQPSLPTQASIITGDTDNDFLTRKSLLQVESTPLSEQTFVDNNDKTAANRKSDHSLERKVVEIQPLSHCSNDSKNNLFLRNNFSQNSLDNDDDYERLDEVNFSIANSQDSLNDHAFHATAAESSIDADKSFKNRKKLTPDMRQFYTSEDDADTLPVPFPQPSSLPSSKSFTDCEKVQNANNNNRFNRSRTPDDVSAAPVKPPRMKDFIRSADEMEVKTSAEPFKTPRIVVDSYKPDNADVELTRENESFTKKDIVNNTAIISHFKESEKQPEPCRTQPPKLNLESDSDVNERLKKLATDLEAKDQTLKELQLKNKSLQEERDLLRRYIEVLISRALSTCPEILSRDDRKISFK